ncbi:MAG: hypothetical protein RH917_03120 [Lacipirellulaceae bacterium]
MKSLFDAIVSMPPPFNMVVFIVMIIFGCITLCEVAKQVRLFVSHRQELAFKRELVDSGMDGREIRHIVESTALPNKHEEQEEEESAFGKPAFEA